MTSDSPVGSGFGFPVGAPGGHRRRLHYAWIIVGLSVLVTMSAIGFARLGYTMVLPAMKEGLLLTEVQAADLATGNLLGYLILGVFGGYLASRFGPRVVVAASLGVISVSMVLTGLAESYGWALGMRILTGLGSGGANVPVMGLISGWFVSRKRGLASGIAVSGTSVALLAAGLVVPLLLAQSSLQGWRNSWFVLGGLVFVITIAAAFFLRNRPSEKNLSPLGAAEIEAPETEAAAVEGVAVEAGAAGTGGERSAGAPGELPAGSSVPGASLASRWSAVYRAPGVWHLGIVYVAFGFSYIIYATFFARYLTGELGMTTVASGRIWSGIGAGSLASGFIWGSISDRIGRKYGLAMVFALQAASYGIFAYWKEPAGAILSAVLFALTAWSIPAIMSAASADMVGPRLAPAGLGFITLFFGIGQVAGPFAAGRLARLAGSYTTSFAAASGAALLGSLLSLFLRRK